VSAIATLLLAIVTGSTAHAQGNCQNLPNDSQLKALLVAAQAGSPASPGDAGGIFHGKKMWGAIVNRDGALCAVAVSTADPTDVWPGSQAIAKHKAYNANRVSGDTACADHEIAKKARDLAALNPPGGAHVDDISYTAAPSPGTPPQFAHPGCLNTFRDGVALPAVTEPPPTGY